MIADLFMELDHESLQRSVRSAVISYYSIDLSHVWIYKKGLI